mgnify:CR=1 FL=1
MFVCRVFRGEDDIPMSQNNYTGIPIQVLNTISRDPVVFFGCSMAEIKKGGAICFLAVFIPTAIIFSFVHPVLGIGLGFALWMISCRIYYARLAKKRSDKPLFYDQHLSKYQKNIFIQPNYKYQRIKNIE